MKIFSKFQDLADRFRHELAAISALAAVFGLLFAILFNHLDKSREKRDLESAQNDLLAAEVQIGVMRDDLAQEREAATELKRALDGAGERLRSVSNEREEFAARLEEMESQLSVESNASALLRAELDQLKQYKSDADRYEYEIAILNKKIETLRRNLQRSEKLRRQVYVDCGNRNTYKIAGNMVTRFQTELAVWANNLSGFEYLQCLDRLVKLKVAGLRLKSLNMVNFPPNMEYLHLVGTGVMDYSFIRNSPSLRHLVIEDQAVGSLYTLEGASGLWSLSFRALAPDEDFRDLPALPYLHHLEITGSSVSGLSDVVKRMPIGHLLLDDLADLSYSDLLEMEELHLLKIGEIVVGQDSGGEKSRREVREFLQNVIDEELSSKPVP